MWDGTNKIKTIKNTDGIKITCGVSEFMDLRGKTVNFIFTHYYDHNYYYVKLKLQILLTVPNLHFVRGGLWMPNEGFVYICGGVCPVLCSGGLSPCGWPRTREGIIWRCEGKCQQSHLMGCLVE